MPTYLPSELLDQADQMDFQGKAKELLDRTNFLSQAGSVLGNIGSLFNPPQQTTPSAADSSPEFTGGFLSDTQPSGDALPSSPSPAAGPNPYEQIGKAFNPQPTPQPQSIGLSAGTVGAPNPGGPLQDYARQAAQRAGIDPELFVRQIQQESGFRPDAVSPAGATGVAQIVPKYHPGVDPNDPYASLDYAAQVMASHLQRYGGDYRRALAAYNAGPGAVDRAGGVPDYPETQRYVANILGQGAAAPVSAPARPAASLAEGLTPNQFGDKELSPEEAYAACGPAAAIAFARANGRNPTLREAVDLAKEVGWTPAAGMAGPASQVQLLKRLGVDAHLTADADEQSIDASLREGKPVTISTPLHYFTVESKNPDGSYNVGQSGTALKAGAKNMTLDQIRSVGGGINGAIFMDSAPTTTNVPANAAPEQTPEPTDPREAFMARAQDVMAKLGREFNPPVGGPGTVAVVRGDMTPHLPSLEEIQQTGQGVLEAAGNLGQGIQDVGGNLLDRVRGPRQRQSIEEFNAENPPVGQSFGNAPAPPVDEPTITPQGLFDASRQNFAEQVSGSPIAPLNIGGVEIPPPPPLIAVRAAANLLGLTPQAVEQADRDHARWEELVQKSYPESLGGQGQTLTPAEQDELAHVRERIALLVGGAGGVGPEKGALSAAQAAAERARGLLGEGAQSPTVRRALDALGQPQPGEIRLGPPEPPRPPVSVSATPEVKAAASDLDKILAERQDVASGRVGRVVTPPDVDRVLNSLRTITETNLVDRRAPFAAVEREIERKIGRPLDLDEQVWMRSRVYEGRQDAALARLEADVKPALSVAGPKLQPYVEAFTEQMDNLDKAASIGRRVQKAGGAGEEAATGRMFSGGARVQQSEQAIRQALIDRLGSQDAQKVFDAAEAMWGNVANLRQRMVDTGLLSADDAARFQRDFPHYVQTRILDHLSEKAIDDLPEGGRVFAVGSNGVKKLTERGTEKARQSTVSTLVDMNFRIEELARRNEIAGRVAAWADQPGMENFFYKLKPDEAPRHGYEAISYLDAGKKQRLAVVQPFVESMKIGTPSVNGLAGVMLSAMRMPLQAGATALRPAFVVTNAVNDAIWTLFRFAAESRQGPLEAARALTDFATGYKAAFGGNPELVQRARLAGGSIGMQSRYSDPALIARQLAGEHVWVRPIRTQEGLRQLLRDGWGATTDVAGLAWSRPIGVLSSRVEDAPRLAAFHRTERQGGSQLEAAMAKRRVSADFAAGGIFTKEANLLIPFLNATTQAGVEFGSVFRRNPARASALMAVILGGIIGTEIYNRAISPQDNADVSRYVKDSGIFVLSDKAPEQGGKRGLAYIPLRGGIGALIPLVRELVGRSFGDNPRTYQELLVRMVGALSPVEPDVAGLSAVIPPTAQLGYELQSNYDIYRQQPIVPAAKQSLPISEQADDRTSETARLLARSDLPVVGGHSPMKFDYAVRGYSPGPGEALLGAADALIRMTGNAPSRADRGTPVGARDIPVVGGVAGRFLRTVGSERQNRAYEEAGRIADRNRQAMVDAVQASSDYRNSPPDRQAQMMRAVEDELQKQAQVLAGVEQKPRNLGLPEKYFGVDPDSRLEQRIDSALGTPSNKRTPDQMMLALQYGPLRNPQYRTEAASDTAENKQARELVRQRLGR